MAFLTSHTMIMRETLEVCDLTFLMIHNVMYAT
jgi:hypothetical protein